jgi:hypothetical protein
MPACLQDREHVYDRFSVVFEQRGDESSNRKRIGA